MVLISTNTRFKLLHVQSTFGLSCFNFTTSHVLKCLSKLFQILFCKEFTSQEVMGVRGAAHKKELPEAQRTQGIDSFNLSYLSSLIECHLHWLQIWPSLITNLAKVVPLVLVQNLTNRWRHQLGSKFGQHVMQCWPPGSATCISYKFGHQMAPLASVAKLSTRWRHLH